MMNHSHAAALLLVVWLVGLVIGDDDPHEWLAQRPCTFSQWPPAAAHTSGSTDRVVLSPDLFQAEGLAERPLLLRTPRGAHETSAEWTAMLRQIGDKGRVRSLRPARNRTERGLYRYLKKFEQESSVSEYLSRMAAARAARDSLDAADRVDGAAPGAEYVFMQTDFVSDGLGALLPMLSPPSFLRESTAQQDMYFILGDKGTGLAFHEHGAAWVTAVTGRKHWLVFDPKYFKRMEDEVREFELPRLRGDFKAEDKMDATRLRRMLLGPADGGIIDDDVPAGFATKGWECVQEPGAKDCNL